MQSLLQVLRSSLDFHFRPIGEFRGTTYREIRDVIGQVRNVFENVAKVAGDDFGLGVGGNSHSALGVVVVVSGTWIGGGGGDRASQRKRWWGRSRGTWE